LSNSFHYWRLNPDQATSDPKKSPDPLAALTAAIEDDNNRTNENKEAEKYGNGQAGEPTKADGTNDQGKDVQERVRCNDSVV
jgi:hypothetical protein